MSLSATGPLQTPRSPASIAPAGSALSFPEKVWTMLACFRSIQLAIVLIGLLAAATLAGVLLPQEGIVDLLQIKKDFGPYYRVAKAMGLFNVYSSYWFIALEVLFFFNLLFGSFQWLKPAFLAATRQTFCQPEHISASGNHLAYHTQASLGEARQTLAAWLRKNHYTLYAAPAALQQASAQSTGRVLLYACKGNFSRLGPVVAHLGILMMLVASVYGVFYGFKAQKLAVPGETFAVQDAQMFKPNSDPAVWQGATPNWKLKVNDFKIVYYQPGENSSQRAPQSPVVKQYFANLSLLDARGREMRRETISVNHPMTVDDTVIYQASFNPTGKLFVKVNGKPMTVSTNTEFMNRPVSMTELGNGRALLIFPFFVQQDPNVTRNYAVFFLRDAHGFVGARPGKMPPNVKLLEGQTGHLAGMTFQYVKPEFATGLQIKKGPEVPWMYLSYLIIILGTVMCVFSQRQIWLAITDGMDGGLREVLLLHKTNKARLSFMKELQRLQTLLLEQLHYQPGRAPSPTQSRQPGAEATPLPA